MKTKTDKNFLPLLATVILIIVFGYIFFQKKIKVWEYYEKVSRVLNRPTTIEVMVTEVDMSGITGKVVLTELDGKLYVTGKLYGVTDKLAKPIAIRKGNCNDLGESLHWLSNVVDGESLSPPLRTTLSGLAIEMPLAIAVQSSVRDSNTVVACGNVPPLR